MKPRKDIITEEEYTRRMLSPNSTLPQEDSPGDSEADAGAEFEMGMNYMPSDIDEDDEKESEEAEAAGENEEPVVTKEHRLDEDELPESAKVISSNQPSPWMDRESTSDTN
jgi:hypothetical protein